MNFVTIAIGSNLDDRNLNLKKSLKEIEKYIIITKKSQIIETEALLSCNQNYKKEDKNPYLNAVIQGYTDTHLLQCLKNNQEIEKKLGRKQNKKWGARIIDIDLIFWNKDIVNHESITIPHKEMHKRYFVLYPLSSISPQFKHPIKKITIKELLNSIIT